MNKFSEISNRGAVPICDYCGNEIKLLKKRQEMTGGVVTIPHTVTRRGNMNLALCNKCLKPVLKEFEEEE